MQCNQLEWSYLEEQKDKYGQSYQQQHPKNGHMTKMATMTS